MKRVLSFMGSIGRHAQRWQLTRALKLNGMDIEDKLKGTTMHEQIFFERMRAALPHELSDTWRGDCSTMFLDRLVAVAKDYERDGSREVADFLLSWWNADKFGKFDVRGIWNVHESVGDDMLVALGYMNRHRNMYPDRIHEIYPGQKSYVQDFQEIIKIHRPA